MTMRNTAVVNSPEIIDILREIQRREGRNQGPVNKTNVLGTDRFTIEVIPFWEAPVDVMGLLRIRSGLDRFYLHKGMRCQKCPITGPNSPRACPCHGDQPVQWARLPDGWLR